MSVSTFLYGMKEPIYTNFFVGFLSFIFKGLGALRTTVIGFFVMLFSWIYFFEVWLTVTTASA